MSLLLLVVVGCYAADLGLAGMSLLLLLVGCYTADLAFGRDVVVVVSWLLHC